MISAYLCWPACVFFVCTQGSGCGVHPAFPAPSRFRGRDFAKLGRIVPRECCFTSSRCHGAIAPGAGDPVSQRRLGPSTAASGILGRPVLMRNALSRATTPNSCLTCKSETQPTTSVDQRPHAARRSGLAFGTFGPSEDNDAKAVQEAGDRQRGISRGRSIRPKDGGRDSASNRGRAWRRSRSLRR